jgi:hypothetical protein
MEEQRAYLMVVCWAEQKAFLMVSSRASLSALERGLEPKVSGQVLQASALER